MKVNMFVRVYYKAAKSVTNYYIIQGVLNLHHSMK